VVAASDWGEVAVISVRHGRVLARFDTGRCAATCVASLPPRAVAVAGEGDDEGESGATRVLVGYNTGILECWTISRLEQTQHEASSSSLPEPAPASPREVKARLSAQGMLEEGLPIRSLVPWALSADARSTPAQDSRPSKAEAQPPSAHDEHRSQDLADSALGNSPIGKTSEFVAMTLESTRQVPAGQMVEVVDVASLVHAFNAVKQSDVSPSSSPMIDLEQHIVLPEAGREIVDPSSRSNPPPPFPAPWVPSPATNRLLDVSGALSGGCSTAAACAFGLADGTVGIATASMRPSSRDTDEGEAVSWGIARRSDQLLLSYPAIGLGTVTLRSPPSGSAASSEAHYLACCLRGGTVYLVDLLPTLGDSDDSLPRRQLKVIAYPKDLDVDSSAVQQVQGFVAANINSRGAWCAESVPVLVYAWPGGILDVYACELQARTGCPRRLLEQLVENGSAQLLRELLMESTDESLASRGELWCSAKVEVHTMFPPSTTSDDLETPRTITAEDLGSNKLRSFRAMLLHLADPASAVD
jgi:hypothetical protein